MRLYYNNRSPSKSCVYKNKILTVKSKNTAMLQELIKYVLPKELVEYFELIEIKEDGEVLHLHLDEKNAPPAEYAHLGLSGNGFYESSTIKDLPLRDRKVLLYVRRKR
jgi:hypothetical protein